MEDAEAVQIGVLAKSGEVLFDQLIQPDLPISVGATELHGVRNEDVATAPRFVDIVDDLLAHLEGKTVAIYSAAFDKGVLQSELGRVYRLRNGFAHHSEGLPGTVHAFEHRALPGDHNALERAFVRSSLAASTWEDVIEPYAAFVGEWHDYWGSYTWQPLYGDHQAISDCWVCLSVLQEMAAFNETLDNPALSQGLTQPSYDEGSSRTS